MKLQLSMDFIELEDAFNLLNDVNEYVDIVEIGTPFLINNGARVIDFFKKKYVNTILADAKIIDGGYMEALKLFDYGADIITVLSHSSIKTVKDVSRAAFERKKSFMIDFINDVIEPEKIKLMDDLSPEYLCVHTANDLKNKVNPLRDLQRIQKIINDTKIAVAGGLNLDNLQSIIDLKPDLLIIGGAITNSNNPVKTIDEIKGLMNNGN